nr:MetaGeneMark_Unknown Function [uncultured bacterium]
MKEPEFYVGYVDRAPSGLARLVGRTVIGLVLLAGVLATALVFAQHPFAASVFEYQKLRTFSGSIDAKPYPALVVNGSERYLLVGQGKQGVGSSLSGLDSRVVDLRGALIYRGSNKAIEVLESSIRPREGVARETPAVELGSVTLAGEIVDTKCHFGVMNPGEGKVHRDCAVRCLSGGIPAGFLVTDRTARSMTLLLADADGRQPSREIVSYVGEPVEITGRLSRKGETFILTAGPNSIERRR